ncbi:MAG: OmpA family protein [Cyanobacteria bacterium P01_A01_bin.123]
MTEGVPTPKPTSGLPKSAAHSLGNVSASGQAVSSESVQDLADLPQFDQLQTEPKSASNQRQSDRRSRSSQASRSSRGVVQFLFTTLFRLMLLGAGGSLSWSVGVLVAHFNPAQSQTKVPLQEVTLRSTNRVITKLRQLPQWWQQDGLAVAPAAPILLPNRGVTAVPGNQGASDSARSELSPAQRETLQSDLEAAQTDLSALAERVGALESDLGQANDGRSLERRLEVIEQLLTLGQADSPDARAETAAAEAPIDQSGTGTAIPSSTTPRLPQVTLPSDVLFERNSSQLKAGAESILDAIVVDLLAYPGSNILIASYTDDVGDAADNRELSFLRASAIERYFQEILGDQYRWVPIGYGETRPLTENATDSNRQRNRRIEITIDQR